MSTLLSSPLDRRSFFRLSGLAGGGLVLAYYLKSGSGALGQVVKATPSTMEGSFSPSAFLRISPNGKVTIVSSHSEMGQGIKTSLPMIIAEELGVAWQDVTVVSAPLDPAAFGSQSTGGSMSTPNSYLPMRRIGATARLMMIRAAAKVWGVPESECVADTGLVRHRDSGKSLTFGELAATAATLPVPTAKEVQLKDPKEYKLLGSRVGGVDNPQIVTGQPLFGIDQKVPGMLYAVYQKCPVFSGKPVSANLDHVKSLPGVRDAFIVTQSTPGLTGLRPGVAVVADSTWEAIKARRELEVKWDEGPFANDSSAGFAEKADAAEKAGAAEHTRVDGDFHGALASAAKTVKAAYRYPWVAHATLEPMNCTAHVQGNRAELWSPTQSPEGARNLVAQVLEIPPENVAVNITRLGGAFGRRGNNDYSVEAALISQKVKAPVHLTWTREDDFQHDHYRPGGYHYLEGGVDAAGKLTAWRHHLAAFGRGLEKDDFPARLVPNCLVQNTILPNAIPQGAWRAPGDNTFAWVICCFLDELAHAAGRDPVDFHLDLLAGHDLVAPSADSKRKVPYSATRMRGVIKLAAEKANWGEKLPRGRGRGIGYYFSHLGYIAEVAEVTVDPKGTLKVDRVVAAVDVGSQIINLSGAEAQIQGSIIDGLSALWSQGLTIDKGRVVESNFHEYPLLRMPQVPRSIDIHYLKTDNPVTGLGEPGLPPLAPAVCNAIFAATGKRLREMPLSRADLRWS